MKDIVEILQEKFKSEGLELLIRSIHKIDMKANSCKKVWEWDVWLGDEFYAFVMSDSDYGSPEFTSEKECHDYLWKNHRIIISDCKKRIKEGNIITESI